MNLSCALYHSRERLRFERKLFFLRNSPDDSGRCAAMLWSVKAVETSTEDLQTSIMNVPASTSGFDAYTIVNLLKAESQGYVTRLAGRTYLNPSKKA